MAFFIYGKVDKGLELSELKQPIPLLSESLAWIWFKDLKVDFVFLENT